MQNEDNDCIRYLMKEMDPSEELLMERAMMEDEDLLIEVESMRQTLKKLDKLPEVEPPSHVTDSIMEQAAQQAEKNRKRNSTLKPAFKYAIAATLALTVSAGGAWLYLGGSANMNAAEQQQVTASTSEASPTQVQPQGAINQVSAGNNSQTTTQFAGTGSSNFPVKAASSTDLNSEESIDPWIDREDIIRFEDQFSNQNQQFQSILRQSTQKLQLIQDQQVQQDRVNSIQLTGSGN